MKASTAVADRRPASRRKSDQPPDCQPPVAPQALGISAAMMTAGWSFMDGLYQAANPFWAVGAALAGYFLAARAVVKGSSSKSRALVRCAMIAALSAICLISADRVLTSLEARAPSSQAFARLLAPVLDLQGYLASAERGTLYVVHPDGLVAILPSCEKLGFRAFAEIWCLAIALHIVLDGRRILDLGVLGALSALLIAFLRFAVCVFLYLEHDDVLVGANGFDAVSMFSAPLPSAVALFASGLAFDVIRRRLLANEVYDTPQVTPFRTIALCFTGSVAIGLLVGFAGACDPPGRLKSGRVLFDDRFCGVWEPTARLLDTEWYGDFSTYSFNALAEWLGHWFIVDVNTQQPYTDDFLAKYDVLILKTPVTPIPEMERIAIDRFVASGGGLLLVGDHTNLLGMGTHLNSLCDKYGIRFRYDSVCDAKAGGFVDYFGPSIGRHVAAARVDHLQFMTSCSLQLDSNAEAILTARSCRRDPHDYANPSFFGRSGSHPELAHGPMVLAASVRAGKGRIAAFTDSTVWSSFGVFQFDREKLAAGLIALLNREPSQLTQPLKICALAGLAIAIFMLCKCVKAGMALPGCLGAPLGIWVGIFGADGVHRAGYDLGPPRCPINEVSFLWQGGSCAFPPVLGDTGSLPLDRAYDTLFASVERLGLVPRIAYTFDRDLFTESTRALLVIAPVAQPPERTVRRIASFVAAGGALIVLDDGRLKGGGSAPAYMRPFDVLLRYTSDPGLNGESVVHSSLSGLDQLTDVPDNGVFVGYKAFGKGRVVYMREAADFSRTGMGHCFARPSRAARARYDTVFWLFRDVLNLAVVDRRFYGICE